MGEGGEGGWGCGVEVAVWGVGVQAVACKQVRATQVMNCACRTYSPRPVQPPPLLAFLTGSLIPTTAHSTGSLRGGSSKSSSFSVPGRSQ